MLTEEAKKHVCGPAHETRILECDELQVRFVPGPCWNEDYKSNKGDRPDHVVIEFWREGVKMWRTAPIYVSKNDSMSLKGITIQLPLTLYREIHDNTSH
jgi:hypothetical protein